ncbi:SH2 domain-containing protein 2A [Ctenodactylus gundi]
MEMPPTQTSRQGNHRGPAPNFSTFQPAHLAQRSCQGLGLTLETRLQALKAEEAQSSLRAPAARPAAQRAAFVSGEGSLPLQAETQLWFQKTQAGKLLQCGAAPAWFHGFISRREAERLLEPQPRGCYLVRFSESAVTFVLTYRSRSCCRHFLLAQLEDGRHVVLGEDSAHARLQDLLGHYTSCPLSPYGETLTQPLARQQTPEPAGLSPKPEQSDARSECQDPNPQTKQEQTPARRHQEEAQVPKEPHRPPRPKPPIPAKPRLPQEVYASPTPRPHRALPSNSPSPVYNEPDEPIAFYAMGRGGPGEAPSNIYAEVERPSGPASTRHPILHECQSRPVSGGQNPGSRRLRSQNSVAGQDPPLPHQPTPVWKHTLPHRMSRQALQDKGQTWLPLGPPQ